MDLVLAHSTILKALFDGGDTFLKVRMAQFLEFSSSDSDEEINRIEQTINFDGSLMSRRQDSLGLFTLGSQSSHSSGVLSDILLVLLEEISAAEFDQFVIEIFSSQMSISGSGFHFEDSFFNSKKGYIESTTSQIEDKDISFTFSLLV